MRQQALIEGKEEVTMFTNKNRIQPFENKVWLASPTMHGNEMKYVTEANMVKQSYHAWPGD